MTSDLERDGLAFLEEAIDTMLQITLGNLALAEAVLVGENDNLRVPKKKWKIFFQ
jgi:hypothetical protein